MTNRTLTLALFSLLGMLLSFCTIQKRSFNRGYHVEWHHQSVSGANTFVHPITGSETQNRHAETNDSLASVLDKTSTIQDGNRISLASPVSKTSQHLDETLLKTTEPIHSSISDSRQVAKMAVINPPDDPDEIYDYNFPRKNNSTALISLIFGCAALLSLCIIIATVSDAVIISMLLSIPAFITGIISLHLKHKYPKARFNKIAGIGLILGIIIFFCAIGYLSINGIGLLDPLF